MMRLLAVAAAAAAASAQTTFQPSQLHISFTGNQDEMAVDFVTDATVACNATGVAYGTSPSTLNTFVKASSCFYFQGTGYLSQVLLTGLQTGTTYYYTAGSETSKDWAWSEMYSFVVPDLSPSARPLTAAVYADFGLYNAESLPHLIRDVTEGAFDFIIHAGDFAYDMDADGGAIGNAFMLSIEPIAATVPYMPSPGNHEVGSNFSQYKNRFAGVTNFTAANSGSPSNAFYSFDAGLVHYISIDTEVYDEYEGPDLPANMLAWLKADLKKANANRATRPWVVAYGHKASYMAGNSSLWEQLFFEGGVDVYFTGHVHSYSRWLPYYPLNNTYDKDTIRNGDMSTYYNPRFMTTIVSGSPGCQEIVAGTDCKIVDNDPQVAHCSNYGYATFSALNETHAHWLWRTAVPVNGSTDPTFSDDFWIVQENHGPRAL